MAQLTDETQPHNHEPRDDNRCAKCRALLNSVRKGRSSAEADTFKSETQGEEPLSKRW